MKALPIILSAVLLTFIEPIAINAASTAMKSERFYGKIIAVDHSQNQCTVRNSSKKTEATFHWDDKTKISFNQNMVPENQLAVGQSLVVTYNAAGTEKYAEKITIRTPFQKKKVPA